jgi:pyruvate dehydrogenase E1 component alpha subunit
LHVLEEGLLETEELDVVEQSNREKINAAVAFAETSPLPEPQELYADVFVTEPR